MKRLLLPVAMLFLRCLALHSEVTGVDSLEWMTADAPLVVRGRVTDYQDSPGPVSVVYRDITIRVEEILKGDFRGHTLKVRLRIFKGYTEGIAWKDSGHPFVFFLREGRAEDDKALVGLWVLREQRQSAIDLAKPERVYTADMKRARDGDEIIRVIRDWAKWKKHGPAIGEPNSCKPQDGYLRLEIPGGAEIFGEVWAGSVCYINVPAEEKYRSLALSKANSELVFDRVGGAGMLRNYPGQATLRTLQDLLKDPAESHRVKGPDGLVGVGYPVRKAAYESLLALGEKPDKPILERPPTPEEVRDFRDGHWRSSMRELFPKDWTLSSIDQVTEPQGWTRTGGPGGIALRCLPMTESVERDGVPPDKPCLTLYVMSLEWEGTTLSSFGESLRGRKYIPGGEKEHSGTPLEARYLGHDLQRHFFCSVMGEADPATVFDMISRYFGLRIETAPPSGRR